MKKIINEGRNGAKTMKRLLSMVLALAIVFTLMPMNSMTVYADSVGGVYINSGAKVTMTGVTVTRSYRGIYNKGTLILKDSNIVRNSGLYGAGVQNETNALVIMDGCSFSENSADSITDQTLYGGGSENKGTMILNNTTMANNYASEGGGGIYNNNTVMKKSI